MKPSLLNLAILFRAAQFCAHNYHNLTKGPTFFQDHEFFGGLYSTYEGIYDSLVERMIGLGSSPDLVNLQSQAVILLKGTEGDTTPGLMFERLLQTENDIITLATKTLPDASEGTKNLLQGICDESESRIYKLMQRIKA